MSRNVPIALLFLLAAPCPVFSASEPFAYTTLSEFVGRGKHPGTGLAGLVPDRNASGTHAVCFDYVMLTGAKAKGRIDVEVEVQSPSGTRELTSFDNVRVQRIEVPGVPEVTAGAVTACAFVGASVTEGDLILWRFRFRKMSKLQGDYASYSMAGGLLPGFGATGVPAEEAARWLLSKRLRQVADDFGSR